MANKTDQIKYNQAIDNISYLILNHSKPLEHLLAEYNIIFQEKPTKGQLINEVVRQLKAGNSAFSKDLESLINKLTSQQEDQFFGSLLKIGGSLIGGLFKKKKRPTGGSNAGAQAAAVKRDMEMRMQRMREEQERKRREEEERRRREEERRRREAEARKKEAEAKKKTNMMLIIGGTVVVLGIVVVVTMKSSSSNQRFRDSNQRFSDPNQRLQ